MKTRRIPPREREYVNLKARQAKWLDRMEFCERIGDFDSFEFMAEELQGVNLDIEILEFDKRMERNLSD